MLGACRQPEEVAVPDRLIRRLSCGGLALLAALLVMGASAQAQDTRVSVGSPFSPFSQNKQNEPAVAIDANHPNVLAAGSNDEIDMEACNAGADNTCPFTEGVGVSGIYFSTSSGASWTQPTYTGYTARNCLGAPGPDADCQPNPSGPIGTLPNYNTHGLVSDGDPALAFGPQPGANGNFSWSNGSRLYYANLTSNFPGQVGFRGAEAIAVSYTDTVPNSTNGAWSAPVIASRQSSAQFSDKEQIWADNASSSPFFGNAYICYAAFRGNGNGFTNQPLAVLRSTDGGDSWTQHQVTSATNNTHSRNGFGRSGCTVRTDSHGTVYVFVYQFGFNATTAAAGQIQMIKSFDGGRHWTRPANIFTAYDTCNYFEPSIGRCVEDGVAGARSDLSPAPSVDIANGAPGGGDATNRIVISWVDGRDGINNEHVMYSTSTTGGTSWVPPVSIEQGTDRGYYSAPAISPNGTDVYVVYNAFTTPFRNSAVGPGNDRRLIGVVRHATAGSTTFTTLHRTTTATPPPGDARASSQNDLAAEFLGDYVYAAATRSYGTAVWNDVRNGADCPAIDAYRQALHDEAVESGQQTAEAEEPRGEEDRGNSSGRDQEEEEPAEAPDVQQVCPANFGESDIYGISVRP
jgi:hypothetical protein